MSPGEVRNRIVLAMRSHRSCLHPLAAESGCERTIVSGHAIARSRVLGAIVDETKHVSTFGILNGKPDEHGVCRVGWRDASTFTGFCSKHDNAAFSALEDVPFAFTAEQCFLHAYRAICWDLFMKRGGLRFRDRLEPEIQHESAITSLRRASRGLVFGIADLEIAKTTLDSALVARDFSALDFACFEFFGQLDIACTGTLFPAMTLSGRWLQDLSDDAIGKEWLAVAVDRTANGGVVVLAWLRNQAAPRRLVDDLLALTPKRRMRVLPQLIFMQIDNVFFSPQWWASRTDETRRRIASQAATMASPNYPRALVVERTTAWVEVGIRCSWEMSH